MTARLVSPSCGRNRRPISEVLLERMLVWSGTEKRKARVLEFACGSGEHAGFVSSVLHKNGGILELWQPTDKEVTSEAAASVAAWSEYESVPAGIVRPAQDVDCRGEWWKLDVVTTAAPTHLFVANMTHISEWESTCGLLEGAAHVLTSTADGGGGCLFIYGPFRVDGKHTAPTNAEFDVSLKARNELWGIRDKDDDMAAEANKWGLALVEAVQMPANNMILVFEKR